MTQELQQQPEILSNSAAWTQDQKERVKKAQDGLNALLEEYNVMLYPQFVLTPDRTRIQVGIIPKPEQSRVIVPKFQAKKLDLNNLKG